MTRFNLGGGEQRLTDLTEALPHLHHRLVVGESRGTPPRGVTVTTVPALRREISPPHDYEAVRYLRSAITARPSDTLIVSHFAKGHLLVGIALSTLPLRNRRPMVMSLSMSPTNEPMGQGFWHVQRRIDHTLRPLVLSVGHELKEEYERMTGSHRVHIVRSSIALDPFVAARERVRRLPTDGVRMLFVGTLEKRKGIAKLPELTGLVRRRLGRTIHMTIAGDGPEKGRLGRSSWPKGVRAEMLGFRSDVHDLMSDADVLVLPSRSEGLSQVLVQAAAIGLPFASNPVPGSRELLALGAQGVVASQFTLPSLAEAVVQAMDVPKGSPPGAWISQWLPESVHKRYREILAI